MNDKLTAACRKLIGAARTGACRAEVITMHPTTYHALTGKDAGDCQHVATVDGVPVFIDSFEKPFCTDAITDERMKAMREMRFV